MRLWGKIQSHDVLILVDSGSSHMFVSSIVAVKLQGVYQLPQPL
jgi:hypothetical protein